MSEIHLTDEQIQQLANQINIGGHKCRFDEAESKTLHRFAQSLENGGWAKWQALLDFGEKLVVAGKATTVAWVTVVVGAILSALWIGFRATITRNP